MSGIAVHVRVKPSEKSAWATADTVLYPTGRPDNRFIFNKVHSTAASNASVFCCAEPLVHSAFDGRNVTIMAYGQTGSGKTHTMVGSIADGGIIPRAAKLLLELRSSSPGTVLSASCVEIYNENVRDLMASPEARETEVQLRDAVDGGVTFDRVQTSVSTYAEFMVMWARAERGRRTGVTDLNEHSSRSHLILAFTIQRPNRSTPSTMFLVDLAGSESASRANTDGLQLREGGFINKSLLSLGNVVDAIVEGRSHVPYRESKLTRLLRNCLGGAGLTFLIATVNPEASSFDQTACTLRFAQRAMKMKLDPTVMLGMVPLSAFECTGHWLKTLDESKRRQRNGYQAGIASAFQHVVRPVADQARFMVGELSELNQLSAEASVIFLAREKVKQLRAVQAKVAQVAALQSAERAAAAAKEQAKQTFHASEAKKQSLLKQQNGLESELIEVQQSKLAFAEESEFAVAERQAMIYTADTALLDEESVARSELRAQEGKRRNAIEEELLSAFRTPVEGSRRDRMAQFAAVLRREQEELGELEAAYEMIAGELARDDGADEADGVLVDDQFTKQVLHLESQRLDLIDSLCELQKRTVSASPLPSSVVEVSSPDGRAKKRGRMDTEAPAEAPANAERKRSVRQKRMDALAKARAVKASKSRSRSATPPVPPKFQPLVDRQLNY